MADLGGMDAAAADGMGAAAGALLDGGALAALLGTGGTVSSTLGLSGLAGTAGGWAVGRTGTGAEPLGGPDTGTVRGGFDAEGGSFWRVETCTPEGVLIGT